MDETPHNNVEGFLETPRLAGGNDALRQQILVRTTRVLRRRRRLRHLGFAAIVAMSYAAGLATVWLAAPWHAGNRQETARGAVQPADEPDEPPGSTRRFTAVQPDTPAPPVVAPDETPPASAAALERLAAAVSEDQRAIVYRRAGDRYLEENNDLPSALRCYRLFLDAGSEEDLTISAKDTWLLMTLKDARLKEKQNAKVDG